MSKKNGLPAVKGPQHGNSADDKRRSFLIARGNDFDARNAAFTVLALQIRAVFCQGMRSLERCLNLYFA
jgi:hypothetical protein